MYGCESWTIKALKNKCTLWCWRRLLRVPWTTGRSDPLMLKETNPEYSLEGLNAKAESPILWPHNAKSWFVGKDPDRGQDWGQEKGVTEDKMVGWHRWLNGHKFELSPGDGEGQGSLACCSPWGHKESDMTEWLKNNCSLKKKKIFKFLKTLNYHPELSSQVSCHSSEVPKDDKSDHQSSKLERR